MGGPAGWRHGYPGAFAIGRGGAALPVEADRYTHVSLRIRASQQTTGSIFWDRCVPDEGEAGGQCRGNVPFRMDAGWNSVQMNLAAASSGAHPWAGQVYGVWLGFAGGSDFDIDWVRLYAPTSESLPAASWNDPSVSGDRGRGDTSGEWAVGAPPTDGCRGGPARSRTASIRFRGPSSSPASPSPTPPSTPTTSAFGRPRPKRSWSRTSATAIRGRSRR